MPPVQHLLIKASARPWLKSELRSSLGFFKMHFYQVTNKNPSPVSHGHCQALFYFDVDVIETLMKCMQLFVLYWKGLERKVSEMILM